MPFCFLRSAVAALFVLVFLIHPSRAALLVSAGPLDSGYLLVHVSDGDVVHHEGSEGEEVIRYSPELDTALAVTGSSWTLSSADDSAYGAAGLHPAAVYRKTKMSGQAMIYWVDDYQYTYEHWLYLQLPEPLQEGMQYTLSIDSTTNIDSATVSFLFDICSLQSEAIHVNIVGYPIDAEHKAADLYAWMGNGGQRDYSSFEGNSVYACNVKTGTREKVGEVAFWKERDSNYGWDFDLTASDVWSADFDDLQTSGTFRLAVEGVGASQEFAIAGDVYQNPFITSLRGYFYMRIGEENPKGILPEPRTPLYIPGKSPADTTVYLTTMSPYHDDWETFSSGEWDQAADWAPYVQSGSPTNPDAWGGHSDAADWDRNLSHVVNIYDLLLPYIMTGGGINDDDTGITESGNGIPDIIDEARYEVDFWLRLRDGEGYSHGLTNPTSDNVIYQAAKTPIAAWANAANAAMLAEAFRISGNTTLMATYRDAAIEAFSYANGLDNPMLTGGLSQDDSYLRGVDMRMMAAAFLYNVTGDTAYEDIMAGDSVCSQGCNGLHIMYKGYRNQLYATAAYLITPRDIHYQDLYEALKSQIIAEAKEMESDYCDTRPSRRGSDPFPSYWQAAHYMNRTLVAHAVTSDAGEKEAFLKAMHLEADWGLGRNPMNMILMTAAYSPLADKRYIPEAFTSGRDDGLPGVHPGHTPFINLQDWSSTTVMGQASALYANAYPADVDSSHWPRGEAYFPSRWVYAHNEFTPRQTMRGKMALYAYLWGLNKQYLLEESGAFPWEIFLPALLQQGAK